MVEVEGFVSTGPTPSSFHHEHQLFVHGCLNVNGSHISALDWLPKTDKGALNGLSKIS